MSTATQASSSAMTVPPAPSLTRLARLPKRPGMTALDRADYVLRIPILSLRIRAADVGSMKAHPLIRGQLMDIPKVRGILPDPTNDSYRLLRLRVQSEDQLPEPTRELLSTLGAALVPDVIELDYDSWTASDILNSILPNEGLDDAPSSFTQTGHIGHVNLKDEWLPYKHLIGQVILDKNPKLRTVVNKLNTIHAEYRYFDMEVLAGDHDFITTVNESNCTFTLDFRHVYWNSRLHHEHERLVSLFQPGEVVADVMAGVGPFAVPAAKKGCYVLGNDLNPESVKWMRENRVKNRVEATLRPSEVDGREFIRNAPLQVWTDPFPPAGPSMSRNERERQARRLREAKAATTTPEHNDVPALSGLSIQAASVNGGDTSAPAQTQQEIPLRPQEIDHFVLNLPDSALTFLDAFRGCCAPLLGQPGYDRTKAKMAMVHVYCFTRELEAAKAEQDICARASQYLEYTISPSSTDYTLHLVRSVAPNKDMYCLSFRLDPDVAFRAPS
ncbi:tRNA(m(1)G37)methyltransferase [Saitozyma podzolica]|uniref:tRNA (guanine(37)-N1)-methyltransferase n=1 Tax=Saitozyma podzolica TaxID=1890683 RepID=A0A427YQ55_9TREE|nr:tRNA(m(1)G37)methyltransferase [Saitozyma podzolica]